jgi:hypothetical protein
MKNEKWKMDGLYISPGFIVNPINPVNPRSDNL